MSSPTRLIILIPVAADALFAGLHLVLREGARAERIVMPAWCGFFGPMVRRQRHGLIEPLAKTGNHLLPWTLETDDANVRLGSDGVFEVRQVEVCDVAQQARLAVQSEPGEPFADHALGVDMPPRQQGRLSEGAHHIGLLIENFWPATPCRTAPCRCRE